MRVNDTEDISNRDAIESAVPQTMATNISGSESDMMAVVRSVESYFAQPTVLLGSLTAARICPGNFSTDSAMGVTDEEC